MLDDKTINSLITDKPQKHLTIFDLLSDINLNYNLTYNTFTLNETKTLKSYFKKSIQKKQLFKKVSSQEIFFHLRQGIFSGNMNPSFLGRGALI